MRKAFSAIILNSISFDGRLFRRDAVVDCRRQGPEGVVKRRHIGCDRSVVDRRVLESMSMLSLAIALLSA